MKDMSACFPALCEVIPMDGIKMMGKKQQQFMIYEQA